MTEPIISIRGLGVRFKHGQRRSMRVRELVFFGTRRDPNRKKYFWPIRDLDLDIMPGEAVGIIGKNGTGKSTLLKMIAGVLIPDEGRVTVRGKVAPMLELSAGFSNELTGRENVNLVGALHGITKKQMKTKFDEIFDFAGKQVQDHIDSPVRQYSSGMRVRLGFAVIAQLEHPILLVDEVMAVGDSEFRQKCYETMERRLAEGRTLVLVSHNEEDLTRFCTRGVYFDEGKKVVDGTVQDALAAYQGWVPQEA
jgi:ABC-2 type transport system ATP-binding protein